LTPAAKDQVRRQGHCGRHLLGGDLLHEPTSHCQVRIRQARHPQRKLIGDPVGPASMATVGIGYVHQAFGEAVSQGDETASTAAGLGQIPTPLGPEGVRRQLAWHGRKPGHAVSPE
jgi:hypothetical protein